MCICVCVLETVCVRDVFRCFLGHYGACSSSIITGCLGGCKNRGADGRAAAGGFTLSRGADRSPPHTHTHNLTSIKSPEAQCTSTLPHHSSSPLPLSLLFPYITPSRTHTCLTVALSTLHSLLLSINSPQFPPDPSSA